MVVVVLLLFAIILLLVIIAGLLVTINQNLCKVGNGLFGEVRQINNKVG